MRTAKTSAAAATTVLTALLLTALGIAHAESYFEFLGCYDLNGILKLRRSPLFANVTQQESECESLCDNKKEAVYKYFALWRGCFCIKADDLVESKLPEMKRLCTASLAKVYQSLDPAPTARKLGCCILSDITKVGKVPPLMAVTHKAVRCETLCGKQNRFHQYFAMGNGCFCIRDEDVDHPKLVAMRKDECTQDSVTVYENVDAPLPTDQSGTSPKSEVEVSSATEQPATTVPSVTKNPSCQLPDFLYLGKESKPVSGAQEPKCMILCGGERRLYRHVISNAGSFCVSDDKTLSKKPAGNFDCKNMTAEIKSI